MIKLVSVGEFGVGKSSLLVRWKEGKFNPNMTPQLGGIDFPSKEIEIDKVKTVVGPSSRFQIFLPLTLPSLLSIRSSCGIHMARNGFNLFPK